MKTVAMDIAPSLMLDPFLGGKLRTAVKLSSYSTRLSSRITTPKGMAVSSDNSRAITLRLGELNGP